MRGRSPDAIDQRGRSPDAIDQRARSAAIDLRAQGGDLMFERRPVA